ncbi:ABC transporter ATP-binding protein [Streptomyces sp. HUAS MG47]|uniref:ABC transporter ATP-binding protein n=1 Tax=Streptomyces solicamelliae TaxID=3231716 RepID=UPI0038782697
MTFPSSARPAPAVTAPTRRAAQAPAASPVTPGRRRRRTPPGSPSSRCSRSPGSPSESPPWPCRPARSPSRTRSTAPLRTAWTTCLAGRYAPRLSGQQQRVALARALALRPRVLLLDEPLSALDAKVRLTLREEIRRIQQELGITTLFVTHDQEEALSMADRVAVMHGGRLEQIAPPAELYGRPATAFVAEFVGTMSRIPGDLDGSTVEVLGRRLPVDGEPPAAGPVDVLVRPEDLTVSGDASGTALVTAASFLGAVVRLTVRLGDGTGIKADLPAHEARALAVGDAVTVTPREQPVLVAARAAA